jgi:hypothetical protein
MTVVSLPVLLGSSSAAASTADAAGLQAALGKGITGEVRFDRLSRAIYSTDASVYPIVPLGVVFPKTADDIAATVRECARFGALLQLRPWRRAVTADRADFRRPPRERTVMP